MRAKLIKQHNRLNEPEEFEDSWGNPVWKLGEEIFYDKKLALKEAKDKMEEEFRSRYLKDKK